VRFCLFFSKEDFEYVFGQPFYTRRGNTVVGKRVPPFELSRSMAVKSCITRCTSESFAGDENVVFDRVRVGESERRENIRQMKTFQAARGFDRIRYRA